MTGTRNANIGGNLKPNCNCEDSIRNGDFHGIDYVICTDCELLEWQGGKSLIELTAIVHIDLPSGQEVVLSAVLDWLGKQLVSHSKGGTIYKIDDSRLAEFFNFANEDFSILMSRRVSIPIYEHLTSYDIRCADDEEELDTFTLLRESLADYPTEEIFEATYKDIYLEMVEYMHKDALFQLGEYLSGQKFLGSPVQVEIADRFIVNPLAEASSKPATRPKSEQKTSTKKVGQQKTASNSTMLLPKDVSDIEWEEFEDEVPVEVEKPSFLEKLKNMFGKKF